MIASPPYTFFVILSKHIYAHYFSHTQAKNLLILIV